METTTMNRATKPSSNMERWQILIYCILASPGSWLPEKDRQMALGPHSSKQREKTHSAPSHDWDVSLIFFKARFYKTEMHRSK